ncbi:MAG: ribose transport system permease protein [Gaiellales bacterium]|nr:ribose transport system permease protein [Gaiellales bacterium]MDX6571208.1 ribose transport system permease protein [Gaiellales bacterium]
MPQTLLPEPRAPIPRRRGDADLRSRLRVPRFSAIWVATAVLFALSPLLASGSVSQTALLSMLPFAAILAIAAIGQTLVIQQRGLDLSVPGMITLTTILITRIPDGHDDRLPEAVGVVLLACIASGLISGIAVTWLKITPLVATLGVNALLQGVVFQITSGASTSAASPGLARFALAKTLGVPHAVIIAGVAILVVAGIIRATIVGRRFVAVGASPAAAHAAGIRVSVYAVATYVFASITYGAAGILVAGFLGTPGISAGNDYLLPTIAAVVLGGTSLVGGVGSVVATGIGALFLTQLEQVVKIMGAPSSVQFVIQGSIIALGMAVGAVHWRRLRELVRPGGPARPLVSATSSISPTSHSLPTSGPDDPSPGETSPASHPRDEPGHPSL